MDKDKIEGKLKDIGGRVERQAGEWTDDKDLQAEGTKDQAKGKAQNTFGKAKDAIRDLKEDLGASREDEAERDRKAS